MAAVSTSTSSQSYNYKPVINGKHSTILRRFIRKIKEKNRQPVTATEQAEMFTGLQPKVIQLLEQFEYLNLEIKEVDRSVIYKKLVNIYLNRQMMPTTYQLFVALETELPHYMHIGEFRKMLVRMNFMWKNISKSFYIIENPEIVAERVNYLNKIIRYRRKKTPVYFIEENSLQCNNSVNSMRKNLMYAVSDMGVQFIKEVDDFTADSCFSWVNDTLLMSLSSTSVIVLNNSEHHCEEIIKLPNADSTKKVMTDWLNYFNIPYVVEMPKVILHDLILKYTNVSKRLFKIDTVLEANGHIVLRIPNCICKVNPGALVLETIQSNIGALLNEAGELGTEHIMAKFQEIIATINEELARTFTEVVAKEELQIYTMDIACDDIMDELQKAMMEREATFSYVDSEIPSSDSE